MWALFRERAVYLDSNILILAVERGNPWTALLTELFTAIDSQLLKAFTSELSLAEVLAKPFSSGASDLVRHYETLLGEGSPIRTIAIDRPILVASARLQGNIGVKLFDAIHVACAMAMGCDYFISNDVRLGRALKGLRWMALSDLDREPRDG